MEMCNFCSNFVETYGNSGLVAGSVDSLTRIFCPSDQKAEWQQNYGLGFAIYSMFD